MRSDATTSDCEVGPDMAAASSPESDSGGSLPKAGTRQGRPHLQKIVSVACQELGTLAFRLTFAEFLMTFLPGSVGGRVRASLFRFAGAKVGHGTIIFRGVTLDGPPDRAGRLRLGRTCFVNAGCRFDLQASVTVGDRVFMGQEVAILTSSHSLGPPAFRAGVLQSMPVTIGDGVWIGARSVILPGVSIGRGSVVAAGAVVTRSIPENVLVAGVPARIIRQLHGA